MYGLAHRIKKELYEIAAERGIENRSKMKCGELLKAIQSTLGKHPEGTKGQQPASVVKNLRDKSREDLYRVAGQKHSKAVLK